MVLPSTFAHRSDMASCRRTCVRWNGTVPVRPEPSLSLKSARPSKPSERQKRITVGWLTSARLAITPTASFSTARGFSSTTLATRRSAGERPSRAWRMRSSSGLPPVAARDVGPRAASTRRERRGCRRSARRWGCARGTREAPLLLETRWRNGDLRNRSPRRGTMPPPTKMPPVAPSVSARSAATVPSIAQKQSMVSAHSALSPRWARRTTSAVAGPRGMGEVAVAQGLVDQFDAGARTRGVRPTRAPSTSTRGAARAARARRWARSWCGRLRSRG